MIPTNRGAGLPIAGQPATPEPTVVLGEEGTPVLAVEKTVDRAFANQGDKNIRYTIVVTNAGDLTAFNVVLTDVLPAGFSYSDQAGDSKQWTLGDIAAGGSMEVSYLANVSLETAPDTYSNLAEAVADNNGPVSASAPLEVRAVAVLAETGFSRNEFVVLLFALITIVNMIHLGRRKLALGVN